MTKDEALKAADQQIPILDKGSDLLYRRISAIYWRYSGERERRSGKPPRYIEVELEPMNGANSITVTTPERIREATEEEIKNYRPIVI